MLYAQPANHAYHYEAINPEVQLPLEPTPSVEPPTPHNAMHVLHVSFAVSCNMLSWL